MGLTLFPIESSGRHGKAPDSETDELSVQVPGRPAFFWSRVVC